MLNAQVAESEIWYTHYGRFWHMVQSGQLAVLRMNETCLWLSVHSHQIGIALGFLCKGVSIL